MAVLFLALLRNAELVLLLLLYLHEAQTIGGRKFQISR